ncbi:ABC transporter substrate-binding protein [Chelativorans sp. ZYF759]|uniref:ABC transporter substrate-binding protein n=1 Tax=Chelativorans sp. ZYF759 TaxID=2692213 RepID=UPI00145F6340|nr:ABC transporter substrate-binding protein [Chelativorans sp. ZYF759]NMG41694.1 ABC transporter substrate-binding protein [Chelativorans sp. ZYF759]
MGIISQTIRAVGGFAIAAVMAGPAAAQTTTGVTDDEILIGIFAPLSGALTAYGTDPTNAARAWFNDVNEKGGIHGRQIRYIVEDDKCTPAEAGAIARKFINVDRVFAMLGGSCSGATVSIQELVNQEQIPHFMLNASGDAGVYPPTKYQFGAAPGTQRATLAAVMSYAIDDLGAKTVGVLGPEDEMGTAALRMIHAVAEKRGVEVVANEIVPNNATDVTVPVLNVQSANPDVIILTTYAPPTTLVMKKIVEFGLVDKPIISAIQGVSSTDAFLASLDGDTTGLKNFYYAHPLVGETMDDPGLKPFKDLMVKHFPDRPNPGIMGAYGFPHAMAIVHALEAAGPGLTREKFMEAIEKTNFESGVMAAPTVFNPERRDSLRGQVIVKFDGETVTHAGGPYLWDEIVDPSYFD